MAKPPPGFRRLKFTTLNEITAEARRLAAAGNAAKTVGNWSLGKTFAHLAAWIEYAYDGHPPVPWWMRLVARFFKRRFLYTPMPPGFRFSSAPEGTYGLDEMPVPAALARLETAITKLDTSFPPKPDPTFGKLTHDEWRAMHLRHAELHLGMWSA